MPPALAHLRSTLVRVCACAMVVLGVAVPAASATTIVSGPVVRTAPHQTTVTWHTDVSASTEVAWDTAPHGAWSAYPNTSAFSAPSGMLHSRTISHLAAGTYYYRVRSVDAGGNATVSAQSTFTVDEVDDVTPFGALVANDTVRSSVTVGNTEYFVGDFTSIGTRTGAGLTFDTATGAAPEGQPQVHGQVLAVVADGAGGWYIGGTFTTVGGFTRNSLAHILPDGGVDPYWNPNVDGAVRALDFDGTSVFAGGDFTTVNGGTMRSYAAAFDAAVAGTGTATSWNPSFDGPVNDLERNGATLYAVGEFTTVNGGTARSRAAAVSTTTATATGWNPDLDTNANAISIEGAIAYVGGAFTQVNGAVARNRAAAFDLVTGSVGAWNPNVNGAVRSIDVDGAVVFLGGGFSNVGGSTRYGVAAVSTGGAVSGWNAGLTPFRAVNALQVSGTSLYITGTFTSVNSGTARRGAAALDVATAVATAWNPSLSADGLALTVAGVDAYVGGSFATVGAGTPRNRGAAIDLDTGQLTPWDPNLNNIANTIASSGTQLYIGGRFSTVNGGVARNLAAGFDTAGGTVTGWNAAITLSTSVEDIEVVGSTVYLVGNFTTVGGASRTRAASVNATTGAVTGWAPTFSGTTQTIEVAGGVAYVGGLFTLVNGAPRNGIAAVNASTGATSAWNANLPALAFEVRDILVSGTSVYFVGSFTQVNGTTRNRAAAVSVATAALLAWNPDADNGVTAITQSGSHMLIGGTFQTINGGIQRAGIARVHPTTGALVGTWDPQLTGSVTSISSSASHLFLGGTLSLGNMVSQTGFSRYRLDAVPSIAIAAGPAVDLAPHQTTITWDTDVSGTTEVAYDTRSRSTWGGYAQKSQYTSQAGTSHSRTLSHLAPGTYYYRVRSVGTDGVIVTSAEDTFVVSELGENVILGSLTADGSVSASQVVGDTVYVGGSFTRFNVRSGSGQVFDATSGTPRPDQPIGAGVRSVIPDGAGGWYVAGWFRQFGSLRRLVHVLPDGGIDPDFDPNPNGTVMDMELVGGTLYTVGTFTSVNGGTARSRAAAFDATTGIATAWNPTLSSTGRGIDVSGGTAYVVGNFTTVNGGTTRNRAAAFDLAAGTATAWNPNLNVNWGNAVKVDGSAVYVGGLFTSVNGGTTRNRLASFDLVNGTVTGWNPNVDSTVTDLEVVGGNVYVGGSFTTVNGGTPRNYLAAISITTGVATAWNPDLNATVQALASNGTDVFAVGSFTTVNGGTSRNRAAALSIATGTATAWNPDLNRSGMAVAANGSEVYVGGWFSGVGPGTPRSRLAALDLGNDVLRAWNPDANGTVNALEVVGGLAYIGGSFTAVNGGTVRNGLAAVQLDSGAATAFNPNVTGSVLDLHVSDSTLLVGGTFTAVNGATVRNNLAQLDRSTGVATAWNPNVGSTVRAVDATAATAYVVGDFTLVNGATTRNRAAAFSLTTGTATAWNPNLNSLGLGVAIDATRVFVAGFFTTVNGSAYSGLAETDPTTGAPTGWTPNPNDSPRDVQIRNSTLWVAGAFDSISAQQRFFGAGYNLGDLSLNALSPDLDNTVSHIDSASSIVLLGGGFDGDTGTPQAGYAIYRRPAGAGAITMTGGPVVAKAPHQSTITWETDVSGTTEVAYDTASRSSWGGYASTSRFASEAGTSHSHTLSHLPPDTYYYRVRSVATDGSVVTSGEGSFVVDELSGGEPLDRLVADATVMDIATSGSDTFLAGDFTRISPRTGSAVLVDAANGAQRSGGPIANDYVYASVPDGAGGFYIAGDFSRVGAYDRDGIAHILADGGVDPDWDPGTGTLGYTADLEVAGGYLYVSGGFTTIAGHPIRRLARIDLATGTVDSGWNTGTSFNAAVYDIEVVGGSLFAAGSFATFNGAAAPRIAKVTIPTAALDGTFNPGAGPNSTVNAIEVSGGALWLAGAFSTYDAVGRVRIAKVDATTGAVDGTFLPGTGPSGTVNDIELVGSSLYLVGQFGTYAGTARSRIARIDASSAALDGAFVPGAGFDTTANTLESLGSDVIVGGLFTTYDGAAAQHLVRIAPSGSRVAWSASDQPNDAVFTIAADADTALVGGYFSGWGGASRNGIAKLTGGGALDSNFTPGTGFGGGVNGPGVTELQVVGGSLFAVGNFTTYAGTARSGIAKLDAATAANDPTFAVGAGFAGSIWGAYELEVVGGYAYVVGAFTSYQGTARNRAAKLNATTGALDGTFNAGVGFNNSVAAIDIEGGSVYVGGSFSTYQGVGRTRAAKLSLTGTLDPTFNTGAGFNGTVNSIEAEPEGIYFGGNFWMYDGVSAQYLAKLDASGTRDAGWVADTDGTVRDVDRVGSYLIAAGEMWSLNGNTNVRGFARVSLADGTLDTTFLPQVGNDYFFEPYSIEVGSDGRIVLGYRVQQDWIPQRVGTSIQSGFATVPWCTTATNCVDEPEQISVSVDSATVALGSSLPDQQLFGTSTVTVTTNAFWGYTLSATDASDTAGAGCTTGGCSGQTIPDWTGTGVAPTIWGATSYGFVGLTVRDAPGSGRLAKWGPGTGTVETDVVNNRYAGLDQSTATVLHTTDRYTISSGQDHLVTIRAAAATGQRAGSYATTVSLTAVANP